MDAWTNSPIRKVNRGWGLIAITAIGTAFVIKGYKSKTRLQEEPVQEEQLLPPGSFVGPSDVQRRSPYEGAGNSYMSRPKGDRFS